MGGHWLRRLPMFRSPAVESDELSRETVFEVLENRRRRYALHYLKQEDGEVHLGPLAEQVAAWETDTPLDEITRDARQRVYVSLLQVHLPAMQQAGLVTFDSEARVVELTDAARTVDIYLEVLPADDIHWAEYYLGVTAVNALVLLAVWQDIYPFSILPDAAWGLFVAGLYVLATLVHHYYHRQLRLGSEGPPSN